jgi:hypothetical protein
MGCIGLLGWTGNDDQKIIFGRYKMLPNTTLSSELIETKVISMP